MNAIKKSFVLGLLMVITFGAFAQQLQPPTILCAKGDNSTNEIIINWQCNDFMSYVAYKFYMDNNPTPVYTISNISTITSTNITRVPVTTVPLNFVCLIDAIDANNISHPSNPITCPIQLQQPSIDSVSVDATNSVVIGFSHNDPSGYEFGIYEVDPVSGNLLLATTTSPFWIDGRNVPINDIKSYCIGDFDFCGNQSALTQSQHNMKLTHTTDQCKKTASLQWNKYDNLVGGVDHYEVMLYDNVLGTWDRVGTTTSNKTNIEIDIPEFNRNYTAYVRVFNTGGTVSASSNRIQINIQPSSTVDFSYIRSVSVINNQYVQIKVLTSGNIQPFKNIILQRSEDDIYFEDFDTLDYQPGQAEYLFKDTLADFNHKTYYYKTYIVTNNCQTGAGYSNSSHNILLEGENDKETNRLFWQNYDNWNGGVSSYTVMCRKEDEDSFNPIANLNPNPSGNSYPDDISDLYESGADFTYFIEAIEGPNNYGADTSRSNYITLTHPPTVYIPNAFYPSSSIDKNREFKPTNRYVSYKNYKFMIFTRTGQCIFSTQNPQDGWDGQINGMLAPADVYVLTIEHTTPEGKLKKYYGTVTLVR